MAGLGCCGGAGCWGATPCRHRLHGGSAGWASGKRWRASLLASPLHTLTRHASSVQCISLCACNPWQPSLLLCGALSLRSNCKHCTSILLPVVYQYTAGSWRRPDHWNAGGVCSGQGGLPRQRWARQQGRALLTARGNCILGHASGSRAWVLQCGARSLLEGSQQQVCCSYCTFTTPAAARPLQCASGISLAWRHACASLRGGPAAHEWLHPCITAMPPCMPACAPAKTLQHCCHGALWRTQQSLQQPASRPPPAWPICSWFNETLPGAPIHSISFLRLDGDLHASTKDALEALYDKVGGAGQSGRVCVGSDMSRQLHRGN